jgi:two-component system, NarL family, response regulator NreC
MRTIAILDDHLMFAEGLSALLQQQPSIQVCACFAGIQPFREALQQGIRPDFLLLDITLPDGNGLDLCAELHTARPELSILMLSMHDDAYLVRRALKCGARAYLLKNTPFDELLDAIHRVENGDIYLPETLRQKIRQPGVRNDTAPGASPHLTKREAEVLRYILAGCTSSQIADNMSVTVKAVEFHRSSLLAKFGAGNTASLVRMVTQLNLLP